MHDWISPAIVAILALYIKFATKSVESYASEKGKNAATKEDISEITQRIESIKAKNAEGVEALRHDLLLVREELASTRSKGRDCLFEFYEAAIEFAFLVCTHPLDAGFDLGLPVEKYKSLMFDKVRGVRISHAKVLVYFQRDDSLLELCDGLLRKLSDYEIVFRSAWDNMVVAWIKLPGNPSFPDHGLLLRVPEAATQIQKIREEYESSLVRPRAEALQAFAIFQAKLASYLKNIEPRQ